MIWLNAKPDISPLVGGPSWHMPFRKKYAVIH